MNTRRKLVHKIIDEFQKAEELSQQGLADRAGTSQSVVQRILSGKGMKSPYLFDVAAALGIDIAEVIAQSPSARKSAIISDGALPFLKDAPSQHFNSVEGKERANHLIEATFDATLSALHVRMTDGARDELFQEVLRVLLEKPIDVAHLDQETLDQIQTSYEARAFAKIISRG
ncbi:MAG: helix-turn-helix transcriptional regulator [Methylocella sp.]